MSAVVFNNIDVVVMLIFSVEYIIRMEAAAERPGGRLSYLVSFDSLVDLCAVLPYWIWVLSTNQMAPADLEYFAKGATVVRVLRLFRILRFERLTNAFRSFDDAIRASSGVLILTGFSALLMWIFFSAALYMTERSNTDLEMARYYKTVPHAMWVTLLNLSGECPLDKCEILLMTISTPPLHSHVLPNNSLCCELSAF